MDIRSTCAHEAGGPRMTPRDRTYFGIGFAQWPPMQVVPVLFPQQSVSTTHVSNSIEHPPGGGTHVFMLPCWRQNPPQHSSPLVHVAPFALHGSSDQKPRMFPV